MSYADYTYYTTTYLGTLILSSGDFARLALQASALIDSMTFNRAAAVMTAGTDTATIDKIKMATSFLAEELQKQSVDGSGGGIISESIGSSSVTYAATSEKASSDGQKLLKRAAVFLANTGLMFRGLDYDEN